MLEKIAAGDICVFKNGQRAKVTAVFNHDPYIRIWFDKKVGLQTTCTLADDFFDYWYDGAVVGVISPNSIVKVIPC